MVMVITTLPPVNVTVTSDLSTWADLAMIAAMPTSENGLLAMSADAAVSSIVTVPVEGGGEGGGGEGNPGGGKGGEGGEGGGSTVQYFHAVPFFHCEEMDSAQPWG